MTRFLSGIRGRVVFSVLAVTAVLYSLLGALGFIALSQQSERAVERRIDEVIDQMVVAVSKGSGALEVNTADGVRVSAQPDRPVADAPSGVIQVVRRVEVNGTTLAFVGTASAIAADSNLRAIHLALWLAVPLASIVTALAAGVATSRALRPVGDITELAATIGAGPDPGGRATGARVPVPDTGDEIERLAATLNEMLGRIESGRAEQRQFTSDAAHELRTPLMALQGELELITNRAQSADDATVARLTALTARLGDRVDDLVLLSTLDEGRPIHRDEVRLVDLLADAVDEAAPGAGVEGSCPTLELDRALVVRALRNMLANAARHTATSVVATVEHVNGRVWVHVDDDGPGIDPAQAERLFRRFARMDEGRTVDRGGAGLGLAIVASVAAAHDGGVAAGTGPLGGARVSIWFPASDAGPTITE